MILTTADRILVENINNIVSSMDMSSEESEYYYKGHKVPRVTKIIQRCNHNDGLMYWANSLGFKHQSYGRVLNEAANIGTQCHENIDMFLSNNDHKPDNIMDEARNAYNSFQKWYHDICNSANVEIVYHEKQLLCNMFGGTIDGLYRINGKNYIIDYKTSNHITYNYCLQIAAYIYMVEASYLRHVDGCIILQLSKLSTGYNEYHLDFSNIQDKDYMEHCISGFLAMTYWYYNLRRVEQGFNNMKWGLKNNDCI